MITELYEQIAKKLGYKNILDALLQNVDLFNKDQQNEIRKIRQN